MDASGVVPVLDAAAVVAVTDAAAAPTKFFLEKDSKLAATCQEAFKQLFDLAKQLEPEQFTPLPELLVAGFSEDQIWEQIELYNAPLQKFVKRSLKRPLKKLDELELESYPDKAAERAESKRASQLEAARAAARMELAGGMSGSDDDMGESDDEEQDGGGLADREATGGQPKVAARKRKKRHEMENTFFSLEDMERFADEGEDEMNKKYDDDDEEDDDDMAAMYGDDVGDDDDDDDDDEEGGKRPAIQRF